ncbi:MAG: hypothetical protein HGA72_07045 [Chlorobiaceae bacterium]|nr:hypothetical protein [Chlorobiaceae bacterium]
MSIEQRIKRLELRYCPVPALTRLYDYRNQPDAEWFRFCDELDQAMTHLLTFIDAERTGEIDAMIIRVVSDHRKTPREKRYQ